jgi:hypothetical protein
MLSGMLIANRFFSALSKKENQRNVERKMLGLSTVLGIVLRVLLMTMFVYVNFVWILGTPASVIIAGLPFIAVFNITLPLYTIPLGFLLGKTINRTLKTNIQL